MKSLTNTLITVYLLTGLVGCGSGEGPSSVDDGTGGGPSMTIAVIPKGLSHEFWKSIHAGALKAAAELDVTVLWQGPEKEDDRQQQITVVQNMMIRGVAGMVLAPLDDKALRGPVEEAKAGGIPTVIIDSGLDSDQYVSFVATDNRKGGELAGRHMGELLQGQGKVVMLRYQEGSASTTNREEGFLHAAQSVGIEIVSDEQYAGATKEEAQGKAENLLLRFTDGDRLTIDGIFCPNESSTYGMLQALKRNGLVGDITFIGFDASPRLVESLGAGQINALVVQNPMRMGYLGVKTMVAHLRGETVEQRIDTGVHLVRRSNMDDSSIHELLYPDLDRWLE